MQSEWSHSAIEKEVYAIYLFSSISSMSWGTEEIEELSGHMRFPTCDKKIYLIYIYA